MAGAEPAELRAGRRHRPALRALHVGHDRQAQGRRARQRRSRGGAAVVAWRTSTASVRGDVWWTASDVGWVVGHSYIVYAPLLVGRDDGALRGQAGRDAGRRRVLAGRRAVRRDGVVHRADRVPGDEEGGPGGRAARRVRRVVAARRCSSPANGWTRTPGSGRPTGSAYRSSTTGGRPRPAGRSPPTCAGSSRCRSSPGRRPSRCPATTSACWTRQATRSAAGHRGCDLRQAAAAARHAADAVGRRRPVRRVVPVGVRRLLPVRGRRVRRRGRLPLRHGPHGRRHQRRRAPALDRLDGGRGVRPPRGGGVLP